MRYAIIILAAIKLKKFERYCEQIHNEKYFNISDIGKVANYLNLDYESEMEKVYDELIKKGYVKKEEIAGNTYLTLTPDAITLCNINLLKLDSLADDFSKDVSLQKHYSKEENLDSFDKGALTHTAKILEEVIFSSLEKKKEKVRELIMEISKWPESDNNNGNSDALYDSKRESRNLSTIGGDDNPLFSIIVVDDEEDITISYKHILENNGFRVEVFNNPFEALEKFRESPEEYYDILLIDMKMPGMSGVELYQEIRKSNKKVPKICFITGYESLYNLLKQSYPEMTDECFIRKPIDEDELVTVLKQELQF